MDRDIYDIRTLMLENCIYSRNLAPFLNSGEDAGKYHFIANHLKNCERCQMVYGSLKQKKQSISDLIPYTEVSVELQNNFNSELETLIKKVNFDVQKDLKMFKFFPAALKNNIQDIFRALTSRTLVRAYFFFGVYFIIMKSLNL